MDLAILKTGIENWLAITAVDANDPAKPPLPVEFGRQAKRVQTKPFVLVYFGPVGTTGQDFPTYSYDSGTDELVECMVGPRRIPLRLSFRAFSQEWGTEGELTMRNARQYAEDFRTRLTKPAAIKALHDAGLALHMASPLVDTDYEYSGRLVSQVDMTVTLGVWAYERQATDDAGYIRTVHIEGSGGVVDEYQVPVESEDEEPIVPEDTIQITVTT